VTRLQALTSRLVFHRAKNNTPRTMNYSLSSDAIIYEFNPHTLIALICLLAAFIILLIRVMIDHTDQAKGPNGKK